MKVVFTVLLGLSFAVAPLSSSADDDDEQAQGLDTLAVQNRLHSMTHEFSAWIGTLPLDAFKKGLTFSGAYSFHLTDLLAWKIGQFTYSHGEEEVFTEFKLDKPTDTTTTQEVEIEEVPQDATQMSEKAPTVTAKQVRKIEENKQSASSTVNNLLNVLSKGSGKPGQSNDLMDLVSTISAMSGPGSNPAFNIAGAIASLLGEGIDIAKQGGGGYLLTLSGEQVAWKGSGIAKLDKKNKPGKVRGKVTKMSPGAKVKGKLHRADIRRVVNSHIGQVQACYEKALLSDPTLGGRIVFNWTVTSKGTVTGVRVRSSMLGSTKDTVTGVHVRSSMLGSIKVASCIAGKIKHWRFPKPEGGDATVTFPFLLRSVSS